MRDNSNIEIVLRFFEALRRLIDDKVIRGKKTFCDRYDVNRRNLGTLEKEPERAIFQPCWLTFLVRDYKVSAEWLLTGNGSFYLSGWSPEDVAAYVKTCRKRA